MNGLISLARFVAFSVAGVAVRKVGIVTVDDPIPELKNLMMNIVK